MESGRAFKYLFFVICLLLVLSLVAISRQFTSSVVLTTGEVEALPIVLRNAAIDARNTRVQMSGQSLVFTFAGTTQDITKGDIARGKFALFIRPK